MSVTAVQNKQLHQQQQQAEQSSDHQVFGQEFLLPAIQAQVVLEKTQNTASSEKQFKSEAATGESIEKNKASMAQEPAQKTGAAQSARQELLNKNLGRMTIEEVIQSGGEDKIVKIQQEAQKESSQKSQQTTAQLPNNTQQEAQGQPEQKQQASAKDFIFANKGYLNNWIQVQARPENVVNANAQSAVAASGASQQMAQAAAPNLKPTTAPSPNSSQINSTVATGAPTALSQTQRVGAAVKSVNPESAKFTAPVAEKVKYISTKGLDKAEIILEPKGIGKMKVEISSASKETSILFKVADEATAQLLASNLAGLKNEIGLSGLDLKNVSIEFGQGQSFSNESFDDSRGQNAQEGDSSLSLGIENVEPLTPVLTSGVQGGGRLYVVI